jgi:peptidoglycan/xylan/chitin deacetylase (PgdA/CDA1 family)
MGIAHRLASMHLPGFLERRALRSAAEAGVTVLMYHEVLPDDVDLPSWLVVQASEFEHQMRHLAGHFEVVPLDTALARLGQSRAASRGERPLAAITFDDGYAGNLHCAAPILAALGLPFTVYVATARIENGGRYWYDDVICALLAQQGGTVEIPTSRGTLSYSGRGRGDARRWPEIDRILTAVKALPEDERQQVADRLDAARTLPALRMMTPAELAELAELPLAEIGNHSHGHSLLDQLAPDEVRASLLRAQALLEDWTGRPPRHLSYPNGNYDAQTIALARELGFATAVTTRSRRWLPGDDALEIPRIGIGRFDSLNLFRAKACGMLG